MKSLSFSILLLLLSITGFTAMAQADMITIVAFGDSLTAGWGLRPGQAYPEVLENMLWDSGREVRIINAGVSGDTSAGGLSRLGWALRDKPDIVILSLGANDGLRGLSTRLLESNLDSMLSRLQSENIDVLFAGMQAPPNMGRGYVRQFQNVYERLAEKYTQKHDVEFYPFLLKGVATNKELNLPDGIHPNEEGAGIIAENLFPLVSRMVDAVVEKRAAAEDGKARSGQHGQGGGKK